MALQFTKATKKRSKLRLAIDGPSGSGKTYTALTAATAIAEGGKIAVIDTERGSASLYSDIFNFDVLELETYSPQLYINAIEAAEQAGYSVIVIDSLSHAWEGEGGALDMVDQAAKQSKSNNTYFAWKNVTPLQRKLVDAILQTKAHIVVTMRSKTEYVIEEVIKNGTKTNVPKKIGTSPVQRSGIEYEFTIFADMDTDHNFMVTKSRYDKFSDRVEMKPGVKFFGELVQWLNSGVEDVKVEPVKTTEPSAPLPQKQNAPKIEDILEPELERDFAYAVMENGIPDAPITYTGLTATVIKGGYKMPAPWCKALASAGFSSLYEVDGIMKKVRLPQNTPVENVVQRVRDWLAAKDAKVGSPDTFQDDEELEMSIDPSDGLPFGDK